MNQHRHQSVDQCVDRIGEPSIAFIVPAFNEQGAIALTIEAIRRYSPPCSIYVCDNHSTDATAEEAERAGAVVLYEPMKGKGNAVRRLFRDVDADIYVMVDGDNTYDLSDIRVAIELFHRHGYDLLTGNRLVSATSHMRQGHAVGNRAFSRLLKLLIGVGTADVFSGLRIMSRRLVRSFPAISSEFEFETELSIFASRMKLPVADFPTVVHSRVGTFSKLNTYSDGFKISLFILRILHREFPLRIYAPLASVIMLVSVLLFVGVYSDFLATGYVERFPTLIFSLFGIATAMALGIQGMILKEISNLKYENRYFAYLGSR